MQGGGVLKPKRRHDPLKEPERFREALSDWFETHGRDYPWRRTRDPYAILVSEVMLQQTQIATVLGRGFYDRFLERFPNTAALAEADDDSLLKAWEGLGYYRRARMLREAARAVEGEHGGEFPEDYGAILALPGVGRYTAGAVSSFAFDRPAPIVDGNIARVLSRLMDFREPIDGTAGQRQLWSWAEDLLDDRSPRVHNSALMELGQTFCRPGVPDCLGCPVAAYCNCAEPADLPLKAKRVKLTDVDEHVVFAVRKGEILLRKLEGGRRSGMWRLPEREERGDLLHRRKYGITRYRVTMHVHAAAADTAAEEGEQWHDIGAVTELVMPPSDRAALAALMDETEEIA
ncbi:hypothetical protein HAHE_22620 [Haloferula helveola]|uniref:Adenine DNA glycosylase n=1 Tax=Haloferula helveola TaxID=490095 RepID=A0ABM7RAF2_9BACT|nr:hypothetical protein HAHE_22620 [Haloferula helveola]